MRRNNGQAIFSAMPILGWITFIIGFIIAIVQAYKTDSLILGILYFLGILYLTAVIAFAVGWITLKMRGNTGLTGRTHFFKSPNYSIEKANTLKELIINMAPLNDVDSIIQQLHTIDEQRETLRKAFDMALGDINAQSYIPSEMEEYINSVIGRFSLTDDDIKLTKNYIEYTKTLIVQDIKKGIIPHRVSLIESPINMEFDENPVWAFTDVTNYEEVKKRTYVGGSHSVNFRIAKGINYRVGGFKGEPQVTSSLQPKYNGALILTNKNIYFYSTEKSMKFPYNKIISFVPLDDGIGIQPNRVNAKTVYFKGLDGKFAFKVVSNLTNTTL